jgi:hypothetical protein
MRSRQRHRRPTPNYSPEADPHSILIPASETLGYPESMTRNMGMTDRLLRVVVGAMLLGLYGALEPPWRYLTLLGLIPLGTALTGNCPLYSLLGISTLRKQPRTPQA